MSEKITFRELVELIAKQSEQSREFTNSFIHELVGIIENDLSENGSVSISGFGKFELRWMSERQGRNPQTGEEITIPGQNKVVFKPYKALREDVNRPYSKMQPQILDETPDSEENGEENVQSDTQLPTVKKAENKKDSSDPEPENGEDLLIERPVPQSVLEAVISDKEGKSKASSELRPFSPVNNGTDPAHSKEPEKKIAATPDRKRKPGGFKWSYAAFFLVLFFSIALLYWILQQSPETSGDAPAAIAEQQEEQMQEVNGSSSNSNINDNSEATPEAAQETTEIVDYSVIQGQSLWSISDTELGDPYLWPWIYHLNQSSIDDPDLILANRSISIPSNLDPENLTPAQREQVALGYMDLYKWAKINRPDGVAKLYLWAVGSYNPDLLEQDSRQLDPVDLAFARNR